eukprot:gene4605-5850_t
MIMQGFVGLIPTVDITTAAVQSFVARWRKLKPTVTVLSNGNRVCHNDTDSDGKTYLYKGVPAGGTGPYRCNGLVYSSFPADG